MNPDTCFPQPYVTRLAPSPTGELHPGNIWSFLIAWLFARKSGGKVLLRIDDIDPRRSRQAFESRIISDLAWLGFDWDGEIIRQSSRTKVYESVLERLKHIRHVYPCFCSRQELRSIASAPHPGDSGIYYAGKCARLSQDAQAALLSQGRPHSLRLECPDTPVKFNDLLQGEQKFSKYEFGGDFPLMRSDGVWSYQLASVIDDIHAGVSLVVRGRDLLSSTPRQIILLETLQSPLPVYAHVPLLLDENGDRLAKRHHSLSITSLRRLPITPQHIIGALGRLANINPCGQPCTPYDLIKYFDLKKLPAQDIKLSVQNFPAN